MLCFQHMLAFCTNNNLPHSCVCNHLCCFHHVSVKLQSENINQSLEYMVSNFAHIIWQLSTYLFQLIFLSARLLYQYILPIKFSISLFTMHHFTLTSQLMNSTSITSRNRLIHSYAKRGKDCSQQRNKGKHFKCYLCIYI